MDKQDRVTTERLLDAGSTLSSLQTAFHSLEMLSEPDAYARATAALNIAMAHSYVAEMAAHLGNGMEFHDALRATVRGELKLSPEQAADATKMRDTTNDPTRHS